MTKSQLVTVVAEKAHLTKSAAKEVIDVLFDEIAKRLKKGEKVVISGFGTFWTNEVQDKIVIPFGQIQKKKLVKGHRVVNFTPGKPLRKKVW